MSLDVSEEHGGEQMEGFISPRSCGPNALRASVLRQIQDSARKHHTTPPKQTQVQFRDFRHPETDENNKHEQAPIILGFKKCYSVDLCRCSDQLLFTKI